MAYQPVFNHYVTATRRDRVNEKWVMSCENEADAYRVRDNMRARGMFKNIRITKRNSRPSFPGMEVFYYNGSTKPDYFIPGRHKPIPIELQPTNPLMRYLTSIVGINPEDVIVDITLANFTQDQLKKIQKDLELTYDEKYGVLVNYDDQIIIKKDRTYIPDIHPDSRFIKKHIPGETPDAPVFKEPESKDEEGWVF